MSPLEAVSTAVILIIIFLPPSSGMYLWSSSLSLPTLQNVQNMFIVSLAVAYYSCRLVMPLNVAYTLMSQWKFDYQFAKCGSHAMSLLHSFTSIFRHSTGSVLAIHDPINYASKRTLKRVLDLG
ncbi:octopamine receptor, partial [Trichonephila inaurata madagascariensis]